MQKRSILIYGKDSLKNEIVDILLTDNPHYLFYHSKNTENALSIKKDTDVDLILIDPEIQNQNCYTTK